MCVCVEMSTWSYSQRDERVCVEMSEYVCVCVLYVNAHLCVCASVCVCVCVYAQLFMCECL